MGGAVDAVGRPGDDDPALACQAGGEVGGGVGAVRGAGAGADEGDGAQGPGPQVGGAPDPEADGAGVFEVVELTGPLGVAGDEEAAAEVLDGGEVAVRVGGGGAQSPGGDAFPPSAGKGVVTGGGGVGGVEESVEEAGGSEAAEPASGVLVAGLDGSAEGGAGPSFGRGGGEVHARSPLRRARRG